MPIKQRLEKLEKRKQGGQQQLLTFLTTDQHNGRLYWRGPRLAEIDPHNPPQGYEVITQADLEKLEQNPQNQVVIVQYIDKSD